MSGIDMSRASGSGPGGGRAETSMDERRPVKIAGLALIASAVLWFLGAALFMRKVGGFYDHYEDDPVRALNVLAGEQAAWIGQTLLFFAGTVAALLGLALLARVLWRSDAAALARAGAVGIVAVAGLNAWGFVLRLTAPTAGVRTEAEVPGLLIDAHTGWLNLLTVALTALTLMAYGAAVLRNGRAKIAGGLVVALSALVVVALLARGSLPPVIVYPVAAVLGLGLLFWRSSRPGRNP